ncbi:hypothetical protein ACM26W_15550 [Halomonas sp. HK25]|uniref:hypothetical protein n=1 Tax=Halomonas sp. HK25 TaxID=3394321 RepID=UPI0039FC6873
MTIQGALTILMYALAPFLWLIVAGVGLLLAVQLVARLRGYHALGYRCLGANLAALAVGLSGLWWIPAFTNSRLAYVATLFDWVAMVGAVIGLTVAAWLVLHPISYLMRAPAAGLTPHPLQDAHPADGEGHGQGVPRQDNLAGQPGDATLTGVNKWEGRCREKAP